MEMTILLLLLFPLAALFWFARRHKGRRHSLLPPSPWRLPLIGNFHQLSKIPHQALHSLAQKYGPIMLLHFGSKPFVVVSSGELAREVTKTHDLNFLDRPQTKASVLLFAGRDDLIFSPHGHFWRCARKICVNELLSVKRVQSFRYINEEEVARLVSSIRSSCLTNPVSQVIINLSHSFLKLATDITSRVVLGERCRKDSDPENHIGQLSKEAGDLLSAFSFGECIPALSWLDNITGFTRRGTKISKAIHAFLYRVIEEHEIRSNCGEQFNEREDFVDILLHLRCNFGLTRDNIRSILVDIFVGGTDTTAVAMEWAMAELMKNPNSMKKVQEEIRSIVGEKSNIQESDINRMEYLKCVIKETLRLHGPCLTGRQASKTVTVGGYEIPAKATALINIWSISRDPVTWDRPYEFVPERFLMRCSEGQDIDYYPFGFGRRICPGAQFALCEAEYAIANVLFGFDWELPQGMAAEDLDMSQTLTIFPRMKVPLRLVPVSKWISFDWPLDDFIQWFFFCCCWNLCEISAKKMMVRPILRLDFEREEPLEIS